jgi:hypothetical protein
MLLSTPSPKFWQIVLDNFIRRFRRFTQTWGIPDLRLKPLLRRPQGRPASTEEQPPPPWTRVDSLERGHRCAHKKHPINNMPPAWARWIKGVRPRPVRIITGLRLERIIGQGMRGRPSIRYKSKPDSPTYELYCLCIDSLYYSVSSSSKKVMGDSAW